MLHICPRLPGQTFNELPFEEEILAFLRFLGHSGEIRKLTDVNINKLHQPWRSFAAIINKCLSRKSTGYDCLRLSQAQILWGLYPKRNVDFAYLLWEDFVYQVEHKDAKKSNEMYYPKFTKTIERVQKMKSSFDTTVTPPPTATAGIRLSTSVKGKQPAKASKAKSLTVNDRGRTAQASHEKKPADDENKDADDQDEGDDDDDQDKSNDDDDQDSDEEDEEFIHPKLSIHDEEETKDDERLDHIAKMPENTDDEGRVVQMVDVHTTQEFEDSHVTLTPVNPDGQQRSSSASSQFVTSMLNPTPDAGIDSIFETTSQMDVQTPTIVAPLPLSTPTLTPSTIATISTVPQAPTPPTTAPSTLLQNLPNFGSYMDQRMNKAVKVAVQIQSDRLRNEAQAENEEFLKNLDENTQKIIKEQVKEQVKVQVSKILPKIEQSVNEQLEAKVLTRSSNSSKTSYAALVEAYESDKIILETYGETVTLKRHRDNDADKDEEPSAGSDWGFKRRKEGNEPKSTSAPKEKATRTTGKSTQGSKYQQTFASDIQPWISELAKQTDSRSSFNELMDTPVDFSAFLMNRLKVDTLTSELLAELTYELIKGSCKSLVELELFLEEVYKATTDQLDWINPEAHQYPHNLLKPLPLIPNSRGRHVILFDHFINNDLEYLRGGALSHKYTTSITKTKAAYYGHIKWIEDLVPRTMEFARDVYSKRRIITVTELKIVEWHNYKHLVWITNVYKKHRNPKACGRPSTRCRKLPEEAQPHKAGYNKLMRIDELHKFSDGTLIDVRTTLDDRLKGIRMKYLPQTIRRKSEKERAAAMIHAIDKQLKTRRIMRSLERYKVVRHRYSNPMIQPEPEGSTLGYPLGSVEVLRYDKRSKSENMGIVPTKMELILEYTQQGKLKMDVKAPVSSCLKDP
nr:hypothetical protein [Tanacetum cinerariifolium]